MAARSMLFCLLFFGTAHAQTDRLTVNGTWNQPTTGSYHLWPITSMYVNASLWQPVNGQWTLISTADQWCYTDHGEQFRFYRNPNSPSWIFFESNWVYLQNPVPYTWYKCRLYWAITVPAGGSNPVTTKPIFWQVEDAN